MSADLRAAIDGLAFAAHQAGERGLPVTDASVSEWVALAAVRIEADTALLQQALDALLLSAWHDMPTEHERQCDETMAALRARLTAHTKGNHD